MCTVIAATGSNRSSSIGCAISNSRLMRPKHRMKTPATAVSGEVTSSYYSTEHWSTGERRHSTLTGEAIDVHDSNATQQSLYLQIQGCTRLFLRDAFISYSNACNQQQIGIPADRRSGRLESCSRISIPYVHCNRRASTGESLYQKSYISQRTDRLETGDRRVAIRFHWTWTVVMCTGDLATTSCDRRIRFQRSCATDMDANRLYRVRTS